MPPVQSCLHCQFLSHVLKALFFNQNSPKMKLFLQKNAKFSSATPVSQAAGGFAPKPYWPPASGCSTTPNTAPQLRIFGYAPAQYTSAVSHRKCVNLIEHQVKCLLERSFSRLLVTVC